VAFDITILERSLWKKRIVFDQTNLVFPLVSGLENRLETGFQHPKKETFFPVTGNESPAGVGYINSDLAEVGHARHRFGSHSQQTQQEIEGKRVSVLVLLLQCRRFGGDWTRGMEEGPRSEPSNRQLSAKQ
jgi:hypothetical protein